MVLLVSFEDVLLENLHFFILQGTESGKLTFFGPTES